MKKIFLVLCFAALSGCMDNDKATKIVTDAGYQDVHILGYVEGHCGYLGSIFNSVFIANKKDGTPVYGTVCEGQFYGGWIQLEAKPVINDNPCGDTIESASPSAFKVLAKLKMAQSRASNDNGAGNISVAADQAGIVYVADGFDHTILKISPTGMVTTIAGLSGISGNVDGVGSHARFGDLSGITVDDKGWVYVSEYMDGVVRKISPSGKVSTLAGRVGNYGDNDGVGSLAGLGDPSGIVIDRQGNVYVADSDHDTIRKISPEGKVSTFAGRPDAHADYDDKDKGNALFLRPWAMALDRNTGMLYVTEGGWVKFLHRISPDGTVNTLSYTQAGVGWTVDRSKALTFSSGLGTIAIDPKGNLYIASGERQGMSIITKDGAIHAYPSATITTHYGSGGCPIFPTEILSLAIGGKGLVATAATFIKAGVIYVAPLVTDKTMTKSMKF